MVIEEKVLIIKNIYQKVKEKRNIKHNDMSLVVSSAKIIL